MYRTFAVNSERVSSQLYLHHQPIFPAVQLIQPSRTMIAHEATEVPLIWTSLACARPDGTTNKHPDLICTSARILGDKLSAREHRTTSSGRDGFRGSVLFGKPAGRWLDQAAEFVSRSELIKCTKFLTTALIIVSLSRSGGFMFPSGQPCYPVVVAGAHHPRLFVPRRAGSCRINCDMRCAYVESRRKKKKGCRIMLVILYHTGGAGLERIAVRRCEVKSAPEILFVQSAQTTAKASHLHHRHRGPSAMKPLQVHTSAIHAVKYRMSQRICDFSTCIAQKGKKSLLAGRCATCKRKRARIINRADITHKAEKG